MTKIILPSKIPFSDVVNGLTDTIVSPLYTDYPSSIYGFDPDIYIVKELIEQLSESIQYFRYNGYSRINDFNDQVVKTFSNQVDVIFGTTYKLLDKNGYGDIELTHYFDTETIEHTNDAVIIPNTKTITSSYLAERVKKYYIEINCTTQNLDEIDTSSTYRYLYLSNMSNIKSNASHILILIHFDKTHDRNNFKATDFKILDLSKLTLNLKIEYNCSLKDILKLNSEVIKNKEVKK